VVNSTTPHNATGSTGGDISARVREGLPAVLRGQGAGQVRVDDEPHPGRLEEKPDLT